jgi:pimeloyl-ACP methyl ester carboxylesterase
MTTFILRLVGVLLVLTAIAMGLSRAPDLPVEALVGQWAQPPSEFIDLRGQLVHLRDEGPRHTGTGGSPPPVVLLHGTSASLHTWEGWVAGLKGQRRVISFDLPGFGLTGPFTGAYRKDEEAPGDYSGDAYARFVIDLLDHLQLPQVVLAGNSLGGDIAWRVAVLAPERVHSLVLVDAAGPAFQPEKVPTAWLVARTPGMGWLLESMLPRALVAEGLEGVYGDPTKVTPALVDRYFALALREGNRRALGERLRGWQPGEGSERIASIRQPTLILWGGRDRLIPPAVGEQFERLIPGSRRVVFAELGHVPHEEDPATTLVPVRAFLGLR